ncbi:MAG: DUF4139 domain-containing protein [Puniceicoccaceae bacterium]
MKRNRLFFCLLACLPAGSLSFAATSFIKHVELYPSGAAVTREVVVSSKGGVDTVVEVKDLPSSILPSSFQISPVDGTDLRVGGFTFLPNENPVEPDDPRTKELRDKLDALVDEQRILNEEKTAIQARTTHYDYTVQSIRKSLEEDADVDRFNLIQEAWSTLERVRDEGLARLAELAEEEKDLAIRMRDARKDLDELVNKLRRKSGVLKFDLSGVSGDFVKLLLRYQVREAGWNPVHEIRAKPGDGKVAWIYKARINQNTGEDWEGVLVSLNSASALNAGGLPPLNPLILSRIEPRSYVARGVRSVEQETFGLAEATAADSKMAMAAPTAQPESTTTGFFIVLPQPLSLESGKEPVVREAFTGEVEAEFWSEAVPELSNEAWLMAGMTNELGWPILAGESYSYIDGQLVARRFIESIASGEETELALGRNEKITIERKERVKKESEGGLIDKTKRHNIKYETTVTNRMAVSHKVILQDRFPIGRDNKIQVRIESPRDVEPEEGTGIFKWERTLSAGDEAILTTEYTVSYPADWTIYPPLD